MTLASLDATVSMTRRQRRNDPFSDKSRVIRHFRLVNRPVSEENNAEGSLLSFDDMFEEYTPGRRPATKTIRQDGLLAKVPVVKATMSSPFGVEDSEEMVDLDTVFEGFDGDAMVEELEEVWDDGQESAAVDAEFIDIEADEDHDRVRLSARDAEHIGEAARYGVLFDDRSYDYMKHLRTIGVTPGAVLINAAGMKKEKPNAKMFQVNFKADVPLENESVSEEEEPVDVAPELEEAKERLVQRYHELMRADGADPVLKEALDALEDDRYVTEEFEDDLVLALDELSLGNQSKALDAFEMDHVSEEEVDIDGMSEELDAALAEYDSGTDGAFEAYAEDNFDAEIDVTGDDEDGESLDEQDADSEQAARVLEYLREQGRVRHSSMYERRINRQNPNLPPLPIAIAQYEELRRELGTDVDHLILAKYAQMDEQSEKAEVAASEQFMEDLFRTVEAKASRKLESIRNVEYSRRRNEGPLVMPQVIEEESKSTFRSRPNRGKSVENPESLALKPNKGMARSVEETVEEKRARKAAAKTEKREKRASRHV
jgi:hypothetical protein